MCMNEWASVIDIQRPLQMVLLYWGFDNCYHWWLWSLAPFGIFRAMLKLETPKINHLCREEMKKNIEAGYLSLKTRLATFTCLSLGVSCVFNGERRSIKHSLFLFLRLSEKIVVTRFMQEQQPISFSTSRSFANSRPHTVVIEKSCQQLVIEKLAVD